MFQTVEECEEVERELYKQSLYHFAKYCLGYSLMTPMTHGPICRALESSTKRKLICVPRGTFKSVIASVSYPLWLLINNPNARIMIDGEIYGNSKNFLREIKGHLKSNKNFIRLFGDWVGDLWNEGEILVKPRTVVKKEPSILCSGIGAEKTGIHVDYIISDDLCSYNNTRNPDVAKKTIDHYRLYTSILEPDGTTVIIGTRYSELDVIGFVIEHELGVKNQSIQLMKEMYGRTPSGNLSQI